MLKPLLTKEEREQLARSAEERWKEYIREANEDRERLKKALEEARKANSRMPCWRN